MSEKIAHSINLPNYLAHKGRAPSPCRQRQLAPFRLGFEAHGQGHYLHFTAEKIEAEKSHRYFLRVESQGSQE